MVHVVFLVAMLFTLPDLNKKYPFLIFSFWILLLFLVLRYNYGNDYMAYHQIHTYLNEGKWAWGGDDILFKYLNLSFPNFYFFITVISTFYISTIYYLIKKNLKVNYYWIAVLLLLINPYLFLVHLSSLRQTIAICFAILAVNYAIKRKMIVYFIFIVIAAGFHKSAIIMIPIYFLLSQTKLNRKGIFILCGSLVLLTVTPLFELIFNAILIYFPNYIHYSEQGLQNSLRSTLISSFFFFLVLFNINKLEGKEIIYGKLALISTVISLLAFKVSMITRIGMYFDIFLIIAIPLMFSKMKIKANKQILFIFMMMIYLLRYVSFFNNPMWKSAYGTYRTILGAP